MSGQPDDDRPAPGRTGRGEATKGDEDDLASRFPNVETDARLRVPVELPEPPKVVIERPRTRAAAGERSVEAEDSINLGRGGSISGGDLRNAGAAAMIGWSLAISIFVGAGLGYLVDRFVLHSAETPWGLIGGFLLGTLSGFVNLVRLANQLNRDK